MILQSIFMFLIMMTTGGSFIKMEDGNIYIVCLRVISLSTDQVKTICG